jgi:predicted aspartyl protease
MSGRHVRTIPALVDTGFNGELLISGGSSSRIPHQLTSGQEDIDVIGTSSIRVARGITTIRWFGRERTTKLWITPAASTRHDPILLLLGTRLLSGMILTVNLHEDLVTIAQPWLSTARLSGAPFLFSL